ncbi:hypothetical protein SCLCIDRAFT_1215183, partial [Scleroderma citrinum Foug A]
MYHQEDLVEGIQPWSFARSLQYDVTVGAGIFENLALELTRKRIPADTRLIERVDIDDELKGFVIRPIL